MRSKQKEPSNLIEAFLASVNAPSVEQAVRDMNIHLQTNYMSNDLYKWKRGDRDIPQKVQNYMMPWAVIYMGQAYFGKNLDPIAVQKATSLLTPPPKRNK